MSSGGKYDSDDYADALHAASQADQKLRTVRVTKVTLRALSALRTRLVDERQQLAAEIAALDKILDD